MTDSIFPVGQKVVPLSFLSNTQDQLWRKFAEGIINEGGMTVVGAFNMSAQEFTEWKRGDAKIRTDTPILSVKSPNGEERFIPEHHLATIDEANHLLASKPYNKSGILDLTRADLGLPARPATRVQNTNNPAAKQ